MKLFVVILCLAGYATAYSLIPRDLDDAHLNTVEIATKYGYPAETHQVQTDDGYLLTLHRIPYGVKCGAEKRKGVAFIQHGMFCSSADWVVMGPERSLAFYLADNCYDVWMGNSRGSLYSRAHNNVPVNSEEYWNFTWHEMAQYDLPAVLDYILHITGKGDLIYIGHSQGTTQYFIFNELHPEYASKVKAFLALAPISFMEHSGYYTLQLISYFQVELIWITQSLGISEFMPTGAFIRNVIQHVCKGVLPGFEAICDNIFSLLCGYDADQLNTVCQVVKKLIFGHMPAGVGTKQLLHYAQSLNSGKFRWFDHGVIKNKIIYGSDHPPEYQLDKVTTPTYLYWAKNDWFAHVKDVEKLKERLPNVAGEYEVPLTKFNHLDYVWGIDVVELVYSKMLEVMDQL